MSGGTPKGKNSGARGRRMADKARGPRREPIVRTAEPDGAADIGVEARIAAGVLLNAALERRNGLDEAMALPLPTVTRLMIKEAALRMDDPSRPKPFLRYKDREQGMRPTSL